MDKLQEVIDFFEIPEGYSQEEVMFERLKEIKELKGNSADEIGLKWDGEFLMTLDDFVRQYYQIIMSGVCNVLKSFQEEERRKYE